MVSLPAGDLSEVLTLQPPVLLTLQKLSSELTLGERGHRLHCQLLGMHWVCGGWKQAFGVMPSKNFFLPGFTGRKGEGGGGSPLYPNLGAGMCHHGSAFPARRAHREATQLIPLHLLTSKCVSHPKPLCPAAVSPAVTQARPIFRMTQSPSKYP